MKKKIRGRYYNFGEKKKKKSFWETFWDKKIFGIHLSFIAGILGIVFFVFTMERVYYCDFNPDECVCEEWDYIVAQEGCIERGKEYNMKTCTTEKATCHKQRKLTPQELLEKDCKDNPRDDEDCKCVEYEQREEVKCNEELEKKSIELRYELTKYYNALDLLSPYINYTITHESATKIRDKLKLLDSEFKENMLALEKSCKKVMVDTDTCTHSFPRPKPIEIDLENEKCVEWTDDYIFVSKISVINYTCLEMKEKRNTWLAYDQYCCTKKVEKTEAETRMTTLMSYSCDKLLSEYLYDLECVRKDYSSCPLIFPRNTHYKDDMKLMKQAWRNKGCEI